MDNVDFAKAIEAVLDGKRISRKEWNDLRHYGILKDGLLQIHKAGEAEEDTHPWILNDGDLLSFDWIII